MRTPVTLGLDLGTSSTKAILVDRDGRTVAETSAGHHLSVGSPTVAEIDVAVWWRSIVTAVRQVVADRPVELAGIGLSGQMHGVVLLDRRSEPLGPAITWADTRSPGTVAEVAELAAPHAPALANPVVSGMAAVTLRWLRVHQPGLLDAASRVLQPKDWLGARLTGIAVSDPTDASATLLWDLEADRWHHALVERLDLDPGVLPEVVPSDDVRGHLTVDVARQLGLPAGLPVTVGRGDTPAALVGSGAAASGEIGQLSVGTGGQICRVVDVFRPDVSRRTHLYRGPGPDQWYAMGAIMSAGLALEWVRRTYDLTWPEFYGEAFASEPGAGGVVFLPYVDGERTPQAGLRLSAGWFGINLRHGRAEILRAALEGTAFALRDAWDALRDAGHEVESLILAGGGSHDPRWRRLLADVLDSQLAVAPGGGGSSRGAALSVGVALGWFDDLGTAASTAGRPTIVAAPEPGADVYGASMARFREIGRAVHGSTPGAVQA